MILRRPRVLLTSWAKKQTVVFMESLHPKGLKMSEESTCSTTTKETLFDPFISDFAKIVETECFVDKTPLLRAIFDETVGKGIVITAPYRFGKSSNMDMVKKFVEMQVDASGAVIQKDQSSNCKIFKDNNLLIYQDKEFFQQHFATYPVISVDFKNYSAADNIDTVLERFRILLRDTFRQYEYLLQSGNLGSCDKSSFSRYCEMSPPQLTKPHTIAGLRFLSRCLFHHFNNKRVFVLIDGFDAPINNALSEKDIDVTELVELLRDIFSNALETNPYVERALLTGLTHFGTVALSGVNNIKTYKFLDEHLFVPYYGLTENEVVDLLTKYQIDDQTKARVMEYYSGYVSLGGTKLLSTWSILNFLQQKEIKNYFVKE